MTHHDKARELVEKLRQWDGCWPAPGLERDVEAAVDLITAQSEENRRLREALRPFASAWGIAQPVVLLTCQVLAPSHEKKPLPSILCGPAPP